MVHLEVDNTTDNKVILDLVRSQIVVAGPQSAEDDWAVGLFLRKLRAVVFKLDVNTVLGAREHIRPDSKHHISLSSDHVKDLHLVLVTL